MCPNRKVYGSQREALTDLFLKSSEGDTLLYGTQSNPEILHLIGGACNCEESELRQCVSASNLASISAVQGKIRRKRKPEVDWNPDVFIRTVDDSDGESVSSGVSAESRGRRHARDWNRNQHPYVHTPYAAKPHEGAQLEGAVQNDSESARTEQLSPSRAHASGYESVSTIAVSPVSSHGLLFPPGIPHPPIPFVSPLLPYNMLIMPREIALQALTPLVSTNIGLSIPNEQLEGEMKELADRVVEYMNGTDTNPEGKPLASEKVQNVIKAKNPTLYENVVDKHFGRSWHRFLQDPILSSQLVLCSIDVNRWFVRLAHDEDWQTSLQEGKLERFTKDERIRSELAAFIKKQPDECCTAEDFLNYLLRADEDPSIPILFGSEFDKTFPRRGQFVRFVKRNAKWFIYEPGTFSIKINEKSGVWAHPPLQPDMNAHISPEIR